MQEALMEGERALANGEIPVGCVIVCSDSGDGSSDDNCVILARGSNRTNESRNGTCHAEITAINDVILRQRCDPSIFTKCDVYVTCEPCIMCAAALAKVGIRRVYFGCHNDRFGGNGSILSVHTDSRMKGFEPYQVISGMLGNEAIDLFQRFYTTENRRCPEEKRKRKRGSKPEA
jgi:tRNA-specific adenosine deaminase 2